MTLKLPKKKRRKTLKGSVRERPTGPDGKPWTRRLAQDMMIGAEQPIGFAIRDKGRNIKGNDKSIRDMGEIGRRTKIVPAIFGAPPKWKNEFYTEYHALHEIRRILEELIEEVDEKLKDDTVRLNHEAFMHYKSRVAEEKLQVIDWRLTHWDMSEAQRKSILEYRDWIRKWREWP